MTRKPVSATNKKRGPERSEMRKAAEAAGMSRGQMYRSLHIASIPEAEFEVIVESDKPPTVTQLVRYATGRTYEPQGRRFKRCPHCGEVLMRQPQVVREDRAVNAANWKRSQSCYQRPVLEEAGRARAAPGCQPFRRERS